MHRIVFLLALSAASAALAAPSANITFAGKLTAEPAIEPGGEKALIDGNLATSLTFAVKTAGEGNVSVRFDEPRQVSALRFYQGSEVYYSTHLVIEADIAGNGQFDRRLAETDKPALRDWVEVPFEPVTLRAIRLRSTAGVSNGSRAHPCLAELQVLGKPEASDMAKASEQGIAIAQLSAVRALDRATNLVVGGRGPAIMVPEANEYADAKAALAAGLAAVKPDTAETVEQADPAHRTVICLGNMLNNPLLERLYWNRYTFVDALTPGKGNYLLHTVYDPYPWSGGNNVIVLGCSDPAGAKLAVEAFLAALKDARLPYTVQAGPRPLVSEAEAARIAASKPNPTFEDFTNSANAYLATGSEAHARRAVAALELMAQQYADDGPRRSPKTDSHSVLPWNEETTSFAITCAWDAFEECPLIGEDLRLQATNAVLQFTRDLVRNVSDWSGISDDSTVAWNHTTFPLLGVYGGARYFQRYYKLADMPLKLQKARQCFMAQARSWKPQEDSDGYITYVPDHTAQYCLSENQMEHFTSGLRRMYGDYLIAICDNRGLGSGFGDSGLSSRPTQILSSLPLTYWFTRDPGYKWVLDRCSEGTWADPFDRGLKPEPPARFLGVKPFQMDKQIYEYTQTYPTYNEAFTRAEVPVDQAFDKISFRDTWDPDAQYLLLDGLGRGKHLHFDTNQIVEFVEGSERWLVDHDYLTRNTTEHNMLTVLRDGRADKLIPSLAGLQAHSDQAHLGYTDTYVKDYNGCDWRRQIVWQRGEYFLVSDTVTPRTAGDYDLELTWKTLDNAGEQKVIGQDFVAERGAGMAKTRATVINDPAASGGKALLMDEQSSRIAFGVNLPPGEYSLGIVGYGQDTSSDSVWVSIDLGPNAAFNLSKGKYAESTSDPANTLPTPKVKLEGKGPHLCVITQRENPPVRVDRFVFRAADGTQTVYEAESLPPAPQPKQDLSRSFHIRPTTPLRAWVTNHERQGISAPISLLHQRQSGKLQPGQEVRFTSLIYTSLPSKRRGLRPVEVAPNLIAVNGTQPGLVVLGPAASGALKVQARSGIITADRVALAGMTELKLGTMELRAKQPLDLELDLKTQELIAQTAVANEFSHKDKDGITAEGMHEGRNSINYNGNLITAGAREAVDALLKSARRAAVHQATRAGQTQAKPLWSAFSADSSISVIKTADLGAGQGQCAFVARGSLVHCFDAAGKELWQAECGGRLKDLAFGDLRPDPGQEIVAGSNDTFIYILSAQGKLLDKRQMRGTPWARSFGDSAYKVYNVGVWDIDGDGRNEILVTMSNFDLQALDADGKLLWKHDWALHGSMQMSFEDATGGGKPDTVFLGNKYGSVIGVMSDGKARYSSYTSIGDVFFAVGDINGDGKPEVVNASSTGDMIATEVRYGAQALWHFDNFGYPVNRVKMADLNGDGRQEVIVASGTGYLYVLDGSGKVVWQDRAGLCVNDVVTTTHKGQPLVAYCDESGLLRVTDGAGKKLVDYPQPQPPRLLTVMGDMLLVGLADGTMVAHKLP